MPTGMANAKLFISNPIKNQFTFLYRELKSGFIDRVQIYFGKH